MKVRDQRNDMEWTVCGECSCDGKEFYIIKEAGLKREHTLLEKRYCVAAYETPPAPRWQDVTGECEVKQIGDATYLDNDGGCVAKIMELNNYRLRKVPVIMQNDHKHEGDAFDTTVRAAFVVERKVRE